MSQLADQLRKLRGNRTLYQVQQETGLPRITISRYERDENTPSINNLKKLAQYYQIDYKALRLYYYEDILTDAEERLIVLSWALKHILPKELNFTVEQLLSLSETHQSRIVQTLEYVLQDQVKSHP
ncbi:MAG: helix-turn-helix transcriptional regulator [Vampirovibrionales bacterium]|nr:helix-turn-helix transcriptional regulator [Vampirovibrionales bacterium]